MNKELPSQQIQEEVDLSILAGLPGQYRNRCDELAHKLKLTSIAKLISPDSLASHITKKTERAKLERVYRNLIDLMFSGLEFVPEHTEERSKEIIEDFHHHYPGTLGYMNVEETIPAHWQLSNAWEVDKYLSELRRVYSPEQSKRPAILSRPLDLLRRLIPR